MRVEVKLKVLKQLYARLMRRCEVPFTNKHTEVMENLLTLGTSHYRNKILVLMICKLSLPKACIYQKCMWGNRC